MTSSTKKKKATKTRTPKIPFVIKSNYLSLTIKGKPHSFTAAHPSYNLIREALQSGDFRKVRKLIMDAKTIRDLTAGKVKFERGVLKYKDHVDSSALSQKIVELARGEVDNKVIQKWLHFIDNAYQNPDTEMHNELWRYFSQHGFSHPITDDGCFVSLKVVNNNYKDCHTGTISNRPGQVVTFPRKYADLNRRTECSYGLHFGTVGYIGGFGSSGNKVMAIKINPRDVIAIPGNEGKGRCLQYEVLFEVSSFEQLDKKKGDPRINGKAVMEIAKDRRNLLASILENPLVKSKIKSRKLKAQTLRKATYGRLVKFATGLDMATPLSPLFRNNMKDFRDAAKLSLKQVATEMGVSPSVIRTMERDGYVPSEDQKSKYLASIETLKGVSNIKNSAVSFPQPVGV